MPSAWLAPNSLAMANLRMCETLAGLAIRDPLAGLFKRHYLAESLESAVRRTARNDMPIGVIMRAVDHFKHFSDPFGHGAGDRLLNRMAQLLRARTRAGGMASRYGGEAFTLGLPQATHDSTRLRAEPLRRAVKQLPVPYASRVRGQLTLALGVVRFPPPGSSAQPLLRAAAGALCAAKCGSRDRVAGAPAI